MVGIRAAALITAVLIAAQPARAADRFPFDVQNGRSAAGLVYAVPADAAGPTRWTRSVRIVGVEDAVVSTEHLALPGVVDVETEAGDTAKLTLGSLPPKQDLAPGMAIAIELTATFPVAGVYKGELVLLLSGAPPRQHVVPIQITVTAVARPALAAMPVEDHSARAVAITEGVTGDASSALAIRLRNASTEPLRVRPAFSTIVRVDKSDTPSYQLAMPEAGASGTDVEIPPNGSAPFALQVDKLDGPGIYSVETVFTDAGVPARFQAQTIKTTVYRRQSWLWAAIAIAIGALLAWAVRSFIADGSKRLALRRRIALLGEHVRAVRIQAGTEPLISAARLLELDVADRDRDARWGNRVDDVEKIIARAEKRLALLRSVVAACGTLALIDADKQTELRKKLDEALVVVRVDPEDDQKVTTAQDAVNALALRAVRRDQLVARLTDLKALIAQQKQVGSAVLVLALAAVEGSLAAADVLIRTDDLDKLDALLDQAIGGVLDACVAELTRLVRGPAPLEVDAETWATTVAEVERLLAGAAGTWKQRNAALLEAEKCYFTAAVGGLVKRARTRGASPDSRAAEFTALAAELEAKLTADPLVAAELYSRSLQKLQAPDPHPVARLEAGVVAKGEAAFFGPAPVPQAGWIPLLLGAIHSAGAPAAEAGSVALDRKLTTTTWLVNAVVLVIAVASGLKALWFDNLAWGGTGAWVTAFLWGAGVQAAGDACAGIAGLRARLSAAAA